MRYWRKFPWCFVLGIALWGCGKKGDPIPLYKQPLFSDKIEGKLSPLPNERTAEEKKNDNVTERTE